MKEGAVFGLGPWELVAILIVAVLVFGAKRLPELGSGLGEGIKNFRKAYRDSKSIDVTDSPEEREPEKVERKPE